MKKKYIIVIGVAALLAVAAIGGTLASDYVETKSKLEAKISEKTLSVAIVDEKNEKIDEDKPLGTDVVPGGEILLNRSISNPEADGYDIYARVSIFYDWDTVDTDEAYENRVFRLLLGDKEVIVGTSYENAVVNDGWIIVENEPGQIVMYYTYPIKSGNSVCFLDAIQFDANMDNAYAGASLKLTYEVDAVQAGNKNVEVAKKAIASEWGVFATIEDGNIVAVSESNNR